MAGLGLLSLLFQDLRWELKSKDDNFSLKGQFTATDLVEDIAANWHEFSSLGRAQPVLTFKNNANDRMSFTAVFRTQHNGFPFLLGLGSDVVKTQIKKVRSLAKPVKDLGRPRIFDFLIGEGVEFPCVVDRVAGIAYEQLRPLTGDHRGFTATISLRRYEPYDPSLVGGSAAESLVLPFYGGESYESLTERVYGTPHLGEALRRRNPDKPAPKSGMFIHIPPSAVLANEEGRVPQSESLGDSEASVLRRRSHVTARNSRTYRSHLLGPEWTGSV